MEKEMKVYCIDCKYYYHGRSTEQCNSPDNLVDTYYKPLGKSIQKPKEKNKDNNCIAHTKILSWWAQLGGRRGCRV